MRERDSLELAPLVAVGVVNRGLGNLRNANILVPRPGSENGENGVAVDRYLLSQLASVDLGFRFRLSLLPPVDIVPGTVLRLALAEADCDVAVELDVVAAGELEGVEDGGEDSLLSLVLPLSEDGRILGASVLVSHQILVVSVIIHALGNTTSGVTSVDGIRLHIYLEHETITYLSSIYILSIGITNSHEARWRRSSVGNGSGCGCSSCFAVVFLLTGPVFTGTYLLSLTITPNNK